MDSQIAPLGLGVLFKLWHPFFLSAVQSMRWASIYSNWYIPRLKSAVADPLKDHYFKRLCIQKWCNDDWPSEKIGPIFLYWTEQVWHRKIKIWVVRSRSDTWTSPAMLVKSFINPEKIWINRSLCISLSGCKDFLKFTKDHFFVYVFGLSHHLYISTIDFRYLFFNPCN